MQVQYRELSTSGIYIVSSDGKETYVFNTQTAKPLTSENEIEQALVNDIYSSGGFDAHLLSLSQFSSNATSAKDTNERKCIQYIGVNMHPCDSIETCKIPCFAVPQCEIIIHSDGFLEVMVEWNAGRQRFDSLLSDFNSNIEEAGNNSALLSEKEATLLSLSSLATNLTHSPIFLNRTDPGCSANGTIRCYEYCPKVDYSIPRIQSALQSISAIRSIQQSVQAQPARAAAIANASSQNEIYLSTRVKDFEALRVRISLDNSTLAKKKATLDAILPDQQSDSLLAAMNGISAQILSSGQSGQYKLALSKKAAYEQAYSDANSRIDFVTALHSSSLSEEKGIGEKITKSERIIGNASAANFRAQLLAAKESQPENPTIESLSNYSAILAGINSSLDKEISAKVMSGAANPAPALPELPQLPSVPSIPNVPKSQIPCLPALIPLLIAGFAFSLRRPGAEFK
ncbi:MAG: hypothetical protein NT051_04895 [Candidatus Micrarchaeota archaeon]|nr:hypothetical protein [Candidatus Micrarchaeota archaeon]